MLTGRVAVDAPGEVDPPVAGTRSERSAPGALVRWVLRCTVLTGLLVGGWLIGATAALAGPLDPEIPLGTGSAPLTASGPASADLLGAAGTEGAERPAVLETPTGSTGLPEIVVTVAEGTALPEVAGLPEIVDTVVGVTRPLLPPAASDEALPEIVDPPLTEGEPAPVSDSAPAPLVAPTPTPVPTPAPASAPVVSGPVAVTPVPAASAAEPAAAARPASVLEGPRTPGPDGSRSVPPCSTGSSSGSGAASGPAVVGKSVAGPAPAALRDWPARTATTRLRGLPQQPSTSPD